MYIHSKSEYPDGINVGTSIHIPENSSHQSHPKIHTTTRPAMRAASNLNNRPRSSHLSPIPLLAVIALPFELADFVEPLPPPEEVILVPWEEVEGVVLKVAGGLLPSVATEEAAGVVLLAGVFPVGVGDVAVWGVALLTNPLQDDVITESGGMPADSQPQEVRQVE